MHPDPYVRYVYILSSLSRVLSIGSTTDLHRRISQHKQRLFEGFTKDYFVDRLVYFESDSSALNALTRERMLKGWRRSKKIALIERGNPGWLDLHSAGFPRGVE
jgi:putative endonuclease